MATIKRLFIAEKPSVAAVIASHLGEVKKERFCYRSASGDVVSWCVGHLLEQAPPDAYNEAYKAWKLDDLPLKIENWKLVVKPDTADQFKALADLIKVAACVIHAGDIDREGQLLVDEVLEYVGFKGQVLRLWPRSLTDADMLHALDNMKPNSDPLYTGFKNAALARSRGDYLIGMNGTRALTLNARLRGGYAETIPVGRIKTPVVSLVVNREIERVNFKPKDHYGLSANFAVDDFEFSAAYMPTEDLLDANGHFVDKNKICSIAKSIEGKSAIVLSADYTREKQRQPLPFALSDLQSVAGRKFGIDPLKVLEIAQSLYEKKFITYPRTDCGYLPEDDYAKSEGIVNSVCGSFSNLSPMLEKLNFSIKSAAWDSSKVGAHNGIMPTGYLNGIDSISNDERRVYLLIVVSFMMQFCPAYEYDKSVIVFQFDSGEIFKATGRVDAVEGWKALQLIASDSDGESEIETKDALPALTKDQSVECGTVDLVSKRVNKPPRFNKTTLLEAMTKIHKYVTDESLRKRLKENAGIGTEATRANAIQECFDSGLLALDSKDYILPTELALVMYEIAPIELKKPDLTAAWEMFFDKLVSGESDMGAFDANVSRFVAKIIDAANTVRFTKAKDAVECKKCSPAGFVIRQDGKFGPFWKCAKCGETYKDYKGRCMM